MGNEYMTTTKVIKSFKINKASWLKLLHLA